MKRFLAYGLSLIAVLGAAVSVPAFAQYGGPGGGAQVATPEQIKECEKLGIPVFTCTEHLILAKNRLIKANENPSTGSGTSMLSASFGDMAPFIAALGAIFGGVAAAFFVMSRKKPATATA
ncbi:MAG: hypothetical protein ACRD3Z_01865 [Nitrososphaerales archaeon]